MKKKLKYTFVGVLIAGCFASCEKRIDENIPKRERSLLEFKIKGQMGTAIIERDGDDAKTTVFILAKENYAYSKVEVTGIVVSSGATASVKAGEILNFSNPEHRAKITVTAESGEKLDWWVYLETYDAFYVGTWKVDNVKIHCDQRISNSGTGVWDTQLNSSEFGNAIEEYDNRVIITLDEGEMDGNNLTGNIVNDAGADGKWSDFRIVTGYYSSGNPLDMNPRLRYLLPPGTARWVLNLTTNRMYITKDNITSTMVFGTTEWGTHTFCFPLPDATGEPWTNNEYSNMWRSSTELFYEVTKIN